MTMDNRDESFMIYSRVSYFSDIFFISDSKKSNSFATDPMDYFLLDAKTGELHTARPLDRESLPDATGLISLTVRVSKKSR